MTPRPALPRRERGITLVEVLIGLLVFSFGLLSLVALQARATQYSVDAEDTNRAALLANELVTAMWTARTVSLPEETVEAWSARVADTVNGGLPSGEGSVSVTSGVATVTITWRPPSAKSTTPDHRYQTQVVMP